MDYSVNKEKGSAIVVILMILVLFTIIGISSLDFSDVETQITHNDRCYKQNLFRAETAVMEACEMMNSVAADQKNDVLNPKTTGTMAALYSKEDFDPESDEWNKDSFNSARTTTISGDSQPEYIISFVKAVDGSEDGKDFKRYEYQIFGRSAMCGGRVDVKAGYILRF